MSSGRTFDEGTFERFEKFEFTAPDASQMGLIRFTARTKRGELVLRHYLGDGYLDDTYARLNGEPTTDYPGLPAFGEETTEDEAHEAAVKAVLEWEGQ